MDTPDLVHALRVVLPGLAAQLVDVRPGRDGRLQLREPRVMVLEGLVEPGDLAPGQPAQAQAGPAPMAPPAAAPQGAPGGMMTNAMMGG